MKFVIEVASKWYRYNYTMKQLKELKASKETSDKDSLESFEKEFTKIKDTIREYTDIPLELKEVNDQIKYNDGNVENYPKVRYVATIGSLKQLIKLSEKCNIIINSGSYEIPYIQFYDDYIE